jgi:putative spermidine/putrescine transport system ATP-binding protein/spermidine/putrescine transport system ATP-binding protein
MSDKIIVMSAGNVEQTGTPEVVYNQPASEFVAEFLGAANLLDARVSGRDGEQVIVETPNFGSISVTRHNQADFAAGDLARLVVRAEKIRLEAPGSVAQGENSTPGRVEAVDYQGQMVRYFVSVGELKLQVIATIDTRPLTRGTPVEVCIRPGDCVVLPAGG